MSDARAPWDEVRARVRALPADARAVFALAVAEHLVTKSRPEQDALWSALAVGWRAATNGDGTWQTVREELERRPDLDDDGVAAVYLALGAAGGSAEDAEWAAQRCTDAAFNRIAYAGDTTAFQPLDVDRADPVVREELRWQMTALDLLEEGGATPEIISRLRE